MRLSTPHAVAAPSLRGVVFPALFAALILAGCAVPPMQSTTPLPETPAAFKEGAAADPASAAGDRWTIAPPAEAQPRGTWWKAFADPTLDALIERAERHSTSLQVAAARLAQARALLQAIDADRAAQVDAGAAASREALPGRRGAAETLLDARANLSYELDLFGRLRQASGAAALDAQASEALLQSTRLLVQSEVAQAYFTLRALDAERALMRETVAAYRDSLRLTERRNQAGDVAEIDVVRLRAEVATNESQALALDRRRAEIEHALAVLVGEPASTFALPEDAWTGAPPTIPAGVPSTVLARRPDVSAAQRSLLAAQARVGVAQKAWFPRVALTASGGVASSELGDLLQWSARTWGLGALLSLPIFDGGRREAGVHAANAQLDAVAGSYREQVLVAFQEVEDQLAALRLLHTQAQVQAQAVDAASRATALSDARYRNGFVSQLELLDARRSELINRRAALQVRAGQYQATIGLIRALGGSWDSGPT
jgi:multidrug efflux system outer membrane protein